MPVDVRALYHDDAVSFFGAGELFLVRWDDTPTMRQLDAMAEVSRPYEASIPGGCGLVNLVVSGKANFTPEFRRRAATVSADPERFRRFRLHVILMEGLRAVTVRMFVNTFARIGGAPVPTAAVSTVEEAATWALPHVRGTDWTEDALLIAQDRVLATALV